MEGGGATTIKGGSVNINGGTCMPAARLGDTVSGNTITSGSSTVCIGS